MTATTKLTEDETDESIFEFLCSGGTYKDLANLDSKTMDAIYSAGHQLYQSAKYEDALKVFKYLCLMDNGCRKYFMALGGCQQMLNQLPEAIEMYSLAAVFDADDPLAPLYAGECHYQMGDFRKARSGFRACIEFAKGSEEKYDFAIARARGMLKEIRNNSQQIQAGEPNE